MENGTFDSIFSTDELQIMKVLLPCLPEDKRGFFAIFIRFQELMLTMDRVRHSPRGIPMPKAPSGDSLMEELLPYCNSSQESMLRQFQQSMEQFEELKDAMEMASMMQDVFEANQENKETEDHGSMDEG